MDFEAFPKIPRLNRDIVVTEKIDGTNAAILIEEVDEQTDAAVSVDETWYKVSAQSRKRLIQPNSEEAKGSDNFGFAGWVDRNAALLAKQLGPGRHFGEWWGSGIQRGYGLLNGERRFSLFNPNALAPGGSFLTMPVDGSDTAVTVDTVPVLYQGGFSQIRINGALDELRLYGSKAAPGFMKPEGIIVYHTAARQLFKVTCEHDEQPKSASIHWGNDGI